MAVLDVWNRALSAAHARGRLSHPDEVSPEQEVLAQWYPLVIRTTQEAAWWPSSRATARLARLGETVDEWIEGGPEGGYAFSYALPENCLRPRHMADFSRFSLGYSQTANRTVISSNSEDPIFVYSRLQEDTTQWQSSQEMATIYALAAHISGPLTRKNSLIRNNFDLANGLLEDARAGAADDIGSRVKAEVPWFAARGYVRAGANATRYYYPFGELFAYAQ